MVLVASKSETLDSHVIAVSKSNISPTNISRKYKMIHDIEVAPGIMASRTETETAEIEMNVDEIFAVSVKTKETIEENNSQNSAADIIIGILDDGISRSWKTIVKEGKDEGLSERTLRRARDQLKAMGKIECAKIGHNFMWTYFPEKEPKHTPVSYTHLTLPTKRIV